MKKENGRAGKGKKTPRDPMTWEKKKPAAKKKESQTKKGDLF